MATNATQDLIASKTAEYSNLPGLILGLDGWLLRSLPADHRAQFLRGYEKVLRVVFHPDRCQEAAQKENRGRYLQAVDEAVRFMLSDEFSYQIATDAVPAHKNPLVALREAVSARDAIISRIDGELSKEKHTARAYDQTNAELRREVQRAWEELHRRTMQFFGLQQIIWQIVRQFPIPIDLNYSAVDGNFLLLQSGASLTAEIALYSSKLDPDASMPWVREAKWLGHASTERLLGESIRLDFYNTTAKHKRLGRFAIVGAMTIAHLCEYIRARTGYRMDQLNAQDIMPVLESFGPPLAKPAAEALELSLVHYLLPFYNRNMILILRSSGQPVKGGESCPPKYLLFVVTKARAQQSPTQAFITSLAHRIRRAESKCFKIIKWNKRTRKQAREKLEYWHLKYKTALRKEREQNKHVKTLARRRRTQVLNLQKELSSLRHPCPPPS